MPGKARPPNKGGNNKPSNRGAHKPGPQPQPVKGRGTTHGGKAKKGAGAGQTRPPQPSSGCGKKKTAATLIAVPAEILWTAVKLAFGWRPDGYQVADIPWRTS